MREQAQNMRILVTGGTGLVGSHLLRALLSQSPNADIRALRRPHSRMDLVEDFLDRVEWIEGDVLDGPLLGDVLSDVGQVYHCAGVVSFDDRRRKEMMRTNIRGTEEVVNAALSAGVGKLVHISSISALGHPRHLQHLDESFVWERSRRNTQYGISKFLAEQEVWRGVAEGLNAVILNPSLIIGRGRLDEGTNRFFKWVARGLPFAPPGSSGFVDVRDVADAAIGVMEADVSGRRYLVNAANLTFREFLQLVADSLGVSGPRFSAGKLVRSLGWRASVLSGRLSGEEPLLTSETAKWSSFRYTYGGEALMELLGRRYRSVEESVAEVGKWFWGEM